VAETSWPTRLKKTKTRAEVEKGFWGKLVNRVMKRPRAFAVPIIIVMVRADHSARQSPALGGISEKYLPPDNFCTRGAGAVRQDLPRLPVPIP